jgi:hypothetical protein
VGSWSRSGCQRQGIRYLRPQISDFLSRLPCVPGHIVQFLLQVLVGSGGRWPSQGFVPFVPQRLYLLFQSGVIALRGQELVRLQVCDLPL